MHFFSCVALIISRVHVCSLRSEDHTVYSVQRSWETFGNVKHSGSGRSDYKRMIPSTAANFTLIYPNIFFWKKQGIIISIPGVVKFPPWVRLAIPHLNNIRALSSIITLLNETGQVHVYIEERGWDLRRYFKGTMSPGFCSFLS